MYLKAKKALAAFLVVCALTVAASAVGAPRTRDTDPQPLPKKIQKFVDQLRRLFLPTVNDELNPPKP